MNIKSLLLGSAAALVAVSGARAADAVVIAEPEPVEYVRVCDVYGTGFYYIPGTETCLRVGGYVRYDIGVGELLGRDVDRDGGSRPAFRDGDSYYKLARGAIQLDARSETELGTLRGYIHINADYSTGNATQTLSLNDPDGVPGNGDEFVENRFTEGTPSDSFGLNHAYIELGGFRVGKTDSLFATMTGYAGSVINDGLVPFSPFGTHQIAYTYTGANGFSAAIAVEEGAGTDTLEDYIPHVVAGVAFTQGWGGVSAVVGYDSQNEEVAGKVRLDVKATETVSLFIMGGYKTDDGDREETGEGNGSDRSNYYGVWEGGDEGEVRGGDGFAVWGGGSVKLTEKATFNAQLSYDEGENFGAVANVNYDLVPGLRITPEIAYADNFDDNGDDDDGVLGGYLRIQRNF